jgi:hypothetical protein
MTLLREMAARAQDDLARAIEVERNMEAQIILEKVDYLRKVARHAYGMVDEDEPTEKSKGERKSRRS